MSRKLVMIGQGAWGRALAQVFRDGGHTVDVWSRSHPTAEFATSDACVFALPAQTLRNVTTALPLRKETPLIITAKGIEQGSHRFVHEVAGDAAPHLKPMILSGPSFAADVLQGLPTAVTLAAQTAEDATDWAQALSRPSFRIYASDDLMGVALGGALKNVLAIACGMSDGMGLGESARAALIARGFSELQRLGQALGAKPQTLMGLSGLGDLLLTCSSPQSRNYSFGRRIGEGQTVAQSLAAASGVVEGMLSAAAAVDLARSAQVDMPITQAVAAIIEGRYSPQQAVGALLSRPIGHEFL